MIRVNRAFVPAALAALVLASASPAFAQRVDLGVTYGTVRVSDASLSDDSGLGWIAQLIPRAGWGLAGGLTWFSTDADGTTFAGIPGRLGRLNVRPLMGGVGYTVRNGRAATAFSVVGGPSFNTLHLDPGVRDRVSQLNSSRGVWAVAVRPGVSVTYTVAPRLDLIGFAGYIVNRPKFRLMTPTGAIDQRWKTDATVINGGVALRLF